MNRSDRRRQQKDASTDPLADLLRQGLMHQREGRLDAAAACYRRVLAAAADHPAANHLLGLIEHQRGREEPALELINRAATANPANADYLCDLGVVLRGLRRYPEALEALRRADALRPGHVRTLNFLAAVLRTLDRPNEAAACYRRAILAAPNDPALHNNLGNVLNTLGETDAALASLGRALGLDPKYVEAHSNLGYVLAGVGRFDEAIGHYEAALQIAPDAVGARFNLGLALSRTGRQAEANEAFRIGLELNPQSVDALKDFAGELARAGQTAEAIHQLELIERYYPDDAQRLSGVLFLKNYLAEATPVEMTVAARRYGRLVAPTQAFTPHENDPDPDRRLRIGLVSADFRTHPVARFLEAVLATLDRDQVELFAYAVGGAQDAATVRLMKLLPNWRKVAAYTPVQLAEAVRADAIDILVDLSGHSGGHRLPAFALKPAPVAVTWLGYFATTGVEAIDYVLGNRWVIPESEEDQWVERPWRMPDTYLCFSHPGVDVAVGPSPAAANGFITFGSLNNLNKLSDRTVETWAKVLAAVPASRLLLRTEALGDPGTVVLTRRRFRERGVEPERLLLEGPLSNYAAHLQGYGRIDIALDPFPYAGGTTSVEALWMGVPVLTLAGDRYVSHMGESILHTVGLPAWIAANRDEYVWKGATFAGNIGALAELRERLRGQIEASPLMDAPRFARNLEAAFRGMWRRWCEGQAKAPPA